MLADLDTSSQLASKPEHLYCDSVRAPMDEIDRYAQRGT